MYMSSSHDTGKGVEQSSVARERESKVQSSQESEDRLRRENDRETQTPPQVEVGTYTCIYMLINCTCTHT